MIIESLRNTPEFDRLADQLPLPGTERVLRGLPGSAPVVLAAALVEAGAVRNMLLVAATTADAEEIEADLDVLYGGRARVFPQRETVHPGLDDPHIEISARRVDALQAALSGQARILVTTGRALGERFPVPDSWSDLEIRLAPNEQVNREELVKSLERAGYRPVSLVDQIGDFSVRGGIVDIYPVTTADPVRIEFWDDRIESIRTFDSLGQRSIMHMDTVRVLPVRFPRRGAQDETPSDRPNEESLGTILDVLPGSTVVMHLDAESEESERHRAWDELGRRTEIPEAYQLSPDSVLSSLQRYGRLLITDSSS